MRPGAGRLVLLLALALLPGFTETTLTQNAMPAPLFGTLTLPDGGGRPPGVLIIPGTTDRNGNRPAQYNDSLKLLARGLAGCGVASLRIDPRGLGDSTRAALWDPDSSTVDVPEADAKAWLAMLRGRTAHPAVLGHGAGGLTALRIADGTSRLVLLGANARRPADLLRGRLAELGLSAAARRRMEDIIAELEAGRPAEPPPAALGQILAPGQTYLISLFKLDPLAELRRTHMPVLVVDGTTDMETLPQDAARLAAARPGVTRLSIAGMNHVLRLAPQDFAANMASYERPDLPLAPGLLDTVCRFLN